MSLNTKVEVLETRLLSDNWAVLKTSKLRITFSDGTSVEQWRETYDRGDGVAILPYDPERGHVLLGRQFRWPAAYNGEEDQTLIEVAAGKLDDASPEEAIRIEAEQELGLSLTQPQYLFELYMSPGSITERLHFYTTTYRADQAQSRLQGLRDEGEEVEVLDIPFAEALDMIRDGRIRDAKTVILLQYAALHLLPEASP